MAFQVLARTDPALEEYGRVLYEPGGDASELRGDSERHEPEVPLPQKL